MNEAIRNTQGSGVFGGARLCRVENHPPPKTPDPLALILVCVFLALTLLATAEEDRPAPTNLRELVEQEIDDVQIFAGDDKGPAKPLITLRWANNTRGSEDGATVLFIHSGR